MDKEPSAALHPASAKDALQKAANAISKASNMGFAASMLHEHLEDVIMARGEKDDQGLFVALGQCLEALGAAADEAMTLIESVAHPQTSKA